MSDPGARDLHDISQARLHEAMPRVIEVLHDLVRELELRNDELMAALAFISEVARQDETILLSDVLGVSRIVDDQTHAIDGGTPSNVLGPFYRPGAPFIDNPGTIAGGDVAGPRILLEGRVTDADSGDQVAGALLDIWQADGEGVYSNEDRLRDPWALRGRQRTGADGAYTIETVRPLHYTVKDDGPVGRLLMALERHPWRPAHIHIMLSAEGYRTLVTQAYIADGPYLDDDTISGVKDELVAAVIDGRIRFDLRLTAAPPHEP